MRRERTALDVKMQRRKRDFSIIVALACAFLVLVGGVKLLEFVFDEMAIDTNLIVARVTGLQEPRDIANFQASLSERVGSSKSRAAEFLSEVGEFLKVCSLLFCGSLAGSIPFTRYILNIGGYAREKENMMDGHLPLWLGAGFVWGLMVLFGPIGPALGLQYPSLFAAVVLAAWYVGVATPLSIALEVTVTTTIHGKFNGLRGIKVEYPNSFIQLGSEAVIGRMILWTAVSIAALIIWHQVIW